MSSMELIKKLRDATGSGMLDCKNALAENQDNLDEAVKWLREKGILKAQKKQDRETKEGIISFYFCPTSKDFTVCKISCETDFVAKNEDFLSFAHSITKSIHDSSKSNKISRGSYEDIKSLAHDSKTIEATITDTISKIGENIQVVSFTSYKSSEFSYLTYLHNKYSENAAKMGSIIGIKSDKEISDSLKSDLKIIPMQVSAMKPMAIDKDSLNPKVLEDEIDIIKKQMGDANPDKIDQIISGKINKFVKENTLLDQSLISDPKMTVSSLLKDCGFKNDVSLKIMLMDLYSI